MRDTVVFDLDGTLVHSAPDLRHCLNHVLASHGGRPLELEAVADMTGDGMAKLFERAVQAGQLELPKNQLEDAYRDFEARYAQNAVVDTCLYPDTARVLDALTTHGLTLAVCTNKLEPIARYILEALGVADRFAVVLGSRPGHKRKPDPAPLLEIFEKLGSSPERAVMIGDSEIDMSTARAAAVPFVFVTFGYCRRSADALGADSHVDAMCELPRALANLP